MDTIAPSDRAAIKQEIVQLMITVPEKIQLQISDALTLIAAADFPDRWEGLLPVFIMKPDFFWNWRLTKKCRKWLENLVQQITV